MIPHAGAIFAILGPIPANSAFEPSVRTMCASKGKGAVFAAVDMRNACLRVFKTSKGEVIKAAVVPLIEPLINETHALDLPRSEKACFKDS